MGNYTWDTIQERMRAAEIADVYFKGNPRLAEFMETLFGKELERYAPAVEKGYIKLVNR